MTDLCSHGDLPAACIDCLTGKPPERPNPPAAKPRTVTRSFTAQYAGHCAGYNTAIHEGQLITRMADDTHRHERCAS